MLLIKWRNPLFFMSPVKKLLDRRIVKVDFWWPNLDVGRRWPYSEKPAWLSNREVAKPEDFEGQMTDEQGHDYTVIVLSSIRVFRRRNEADLG